MMKKAKIMVKKIRRPRQENYKDEEEEQKED
jgi:hypothetical protein